MLIYKIAGHEVTDADEARLQRALKYAYENKERPVCSCRSKGIEMYVAKIGEKYAIKRMPNTGADHWPGCVSYEPPPANSGLGEVMGTAIVDDPNKGTTTLKLAFSLSKNSEGKAPPATDSESDSVKTDGSKLTMRGMLHYIWKESGLHRWQPDMPIRLTWPVIREKLLLAAGNKISKGKNVLEYLFIPEPWSVERKDEIANRRLGTFVKASTASKGVRRLMIAIAEVKSFGTARYGFQIQFKQADCVFMMNEDIHRRMNKRFAREIDIWNADTEKKVHLMAIATFSVGPTNIPSIEEIALMVTHPTWIPVDTAADYALVSKLCDARRSFEKGLRYNLGPSKPLACVTLIDTDPAVAAFIQPADASDEYVKEQDTLIAESKSPFWLWKVGEAELPELPPPARK